MPAVKEKPAVEEAGHREKPVLVDLEADEVHSSWIFHFCGSTKVEKKPIVEGWVRRTGWVGRGLNSIRV
jgi:hypothetical protein